MSKPLATRMKWIGGLLLLGGVGLIPLAWVQRDRILASYYVHGLLNAAEKDRDAWAERVTRLGESALPALVSCMARGDVKGCARAEFCLGQLAKRWSGEDPRSAAIVAQLALE